MNSLDSQRNSRPTDRNRLLGSIFLAAGAILLIWSLTFFFLPPLDQTVFPARVGKAMSDFHLMDLNGNEVRLSDYKGKTVLINVWVSWCPPCLAEMPDLIDFYTNHQDKNFVVLAINAGESKAIANNFAEKMGMNFPVLLDPYHRVLDMMGIDSYPTSILVGPEGVVKKIQIGMFINGDLEVEIAPFLE